MIGSRSSVGWGFVRCALSALLVMLIPPALAALHTLAGLDVDSKVLHGLLATSMAAAAVQVAAGFVGLGKDA